MAVVCAALAEGTVEKQGEAEAVSYLGAAAVVVAAAVDLAGTADVLAVFVDEIESVVAAEIVESVVEGIVAAAVQVLAWSLEDYIETDWGHRRIRLLVEGLAEDVAWRP